MARCEMFLWLELKTELSQGRSECVCMRVHVRMCVPMLWWTTEMLTKPITYSRLRSYPQIVYWGQIYRGTQSIVCWHCIQSGQRFTSGEKSVPIFSTILTTAVCLLLNMHVFLLFLQYKSKSHQLKESVGGGYWLNTGRCTSMQHQM